MPSIVVHTSNLSTQEVEARGSEFKDTLDYKRLCLKRIAKWQF